MSNIGHNSENREYDICLLERKWWAIDEMLIAFDEDELPDDIYEKLYTERNRIEDLMSKLKPATPKEMAAQLRLIKKVYDITWECTKDEEPSPVSKNIYQTIDNIVEVMEGKIDVPA